MLLLTKKIVGTVKGPRAVVHFLLQLGHGFFVLLHSVLLSFVAFVLLFPIVDATKNNLFIAASSIPKLFFLSTHFGCIYRINKTPLTAVHIFVNFIRHSVQS